MVPVAGLARSEALPDPPAHGDGRRLSTILIIEDDPTVRTIVRRHLEADGTGCSRRWTGTAGSI